MVALILARGGSKGIPRKNLAVIQNTTLLRRSLDTINDCGCMMNIFLKFELKSYLYDNQHVLLVFVKYEGNKNTLKHLNLILKILFLEFLILFRQTEIYNCVFTPTVLILILTNIKL